MKPIRIEFEWTLDDYLEAQKLATGILPRIWKFFLWLQFGLFAFVLSVLGIVDSSALDDGVLFNTASLFLAFLLLFSASPYLNRLLCKRAFQKDRLEGKPLSYQITEDGLQMSSPDADSKVKWSLFSKWMEGPNIFTLFSGRIFYAVPKNKLGERETEFRELLVERIGPKNKVKKK